MRQLSFEQVAYSSCAITGHREIEGKIFPKKVEQALEEIIQMGVTTFYNGLALGWDLLTAERIIKLKKKYPQVRLIGCVPFYGQEVYFPDKDKVRYAKALKGCDEVILLSDKYYNGCLLRRNDYMIERADMLFAYCVRNAGGAAYTVRKFALKKGKENIRFFV